MTRRIVVMVECEACNGSGRFGYPSGRSYGLWLAVDCSECLVRGETESDDLSAKAQKVLEQLAEDDEMWIYGEVDTYCRYCESLRDQPHADDCPHVLAKEVLGT